MNRRLFTACLGTETNSFSPIPTGLGLFESTLLVRAGNFPNNVSLFGLPLIVWRDRARAMGWEVAEGLAAFATPAGVTTRDAYESLRDEILEDLEQSMPVDAVLLSLHGAMVAEGYQDAEGDLLSRIRAIVGSDIPLLAELDLHGHQTHMKLSAADVLVYFKEYPHIDAIDRAHEVFDLAVGMINNELVPTMAVHDCRMLGMFATTREPMQSFVSRMKTIEQDPGILSVSLVHGFPWSDMPDIGMQTLVITDNNAQLAQDIATELGEWLWQHRENIVIPFIDMDTAIDQVIAAEPNGHPFVLADTADNTGAGAAGDSTYVLHRLLERQVGSFAIAPLWDPVAVTIAFEAGLGAELPIRIGGKSGPASGDPVDCMVTVMNLATGTTQPYGGGTEQLGDVAWLRIGDAQDNANAIDIVVNTKRVQAFDPVCFTGIGIDINTPKALIVKSTQHFHGGFAPIARKILYMATPGCASMDFGQIEHQSVTRHLWPRYDDPFQTATPAFDKHQDIETATEDKVPPRL
ncbi:MAG: M81 family metallopeptidase [Granulosicoccus sp.]|nr:M81 family metallopeptidase [Granulosicoccus sp.]